MGLLLWSLLMFPSKIPILVPPSLTTWFFSPRAASRAASPADGLRLLHLKFAGLSNWTNIFSCEKTGAKKTFIWTQPHFVSSSILFDWRNWLFSLEFFLVIDSCCPWIHIIFPLFRRFYKRLLSSHFVSRLNKNTNELQQKLIMPPMKLNCLVTLPW